MKKKAHLRPKQRQMHHLGLFLSSLASVKYFVDYTYIYRKTLTSIKKHEKRKNKHSPVAQTMCLILFEPVCGDHFGGGGHHSVVSNQKKKINNI